MNQLNIFQRLAAVMKEVAYIRKEKKVETYMAVTHDQVTAEVRQWFVAHGICVVPQLVEQKTVETGAKSSKGTALIRFEGVFDIAFVNVDNPAESAVARVAAHANDYGDKAPGKALSYATKSALLKVLMIETGENDESRIGSELTPEQIVEFESRMEEATDKEALAAVLKEAIIEAKDSQDVYAARRLRKHAEKLAKKFNEFMPTPSEKSTVPPPGASYSDTTASEPQPATAPSDKKPMEDRKPERTEPNKEVKLATAGMMATVRKAMERTSKTEEQLVEKFKFGSNAIPAERINEVISWARS